MRRLYLHLPRFPVQRKVLETPSLKGAPLLLAEELRGHRRVACASTSALREGIRPGMTVTAAQALVPTVAVFTHSPKDEEAALLSLGEALMQFGPAFELKPPEGLFLDASAAPLFKGEPGLCARVLELCEARGYKAKVCVASTAFTARALARHGARRVEVVGPYEAQVALSPLPLMALDEVEPGIAAQLSALGLGTLGEVGALPVGAVVARMGAQGLRAHALCRGVDDTLMRPAVLPEKVEERIELDWPAESMEPLQFALKTVLDRCCGRLAGRSLAAVRLTVALKLEPCGEARVPLQLSRPTTVSKLLLELVRHRLSDLQLENPIARVTVSVDEAVADKGQQLSLGDGPQGDAALEVVLSRLATTLGEETLFSAELLAQHKPEKAYRPAGFHPPERARGLLSEAQTQQQAELLPATASSAKEREPSVPAGWSGLEGDFGRAVKRPGRPDLKLDDDGPTEPQLAAAKAMVERPLRLFSTPSALEVEVTEKGAVVAARISGRRRKAVAIAGPERLVGDWWDQEPFCRDYYRVHFDGMGPLWIFKDERDGRFYLQGMFD